LSGRSLLGTREAEAIARKLDAEVSAGRKHTLAKVRINGVYIGQFGIRRGTDVGHDYIPRQSHVTARQALELARCTLYKNDYEALLVAQGKLPAAG
jgi:hypothetical protein